MLELSNVEVIYSDVILAVKGITLVVPKGSASRSWAATELGKSTTLKSTSRTSSRTEDGKRDVGDDFVRAARGSTVVVIRAKIVRNGISPSSWRAAASSVT